MSTLTDWLATNVQRVGALRDNPLFLALLCSYKQHRDALPPNVYDVYQDFITDRLSNANQLIQRAYALEQRELAVYAEAIGAAMAAEPLLGLNPAVDALAATVATLVRSTSERFDSVIDALVELRLGKAEIDLQGVRRFAFIHRRFQEFFATNALRSGRLEVQPERLLGDPSWREPTAALMQTRSIAELKPLFDVATQRMQAYRDSVVSSRTTKGTPFDWPDGVLHLLSLLQDGLRGRSDEAPLPLREAANQILSRIYRDGTRLDQKWVLDSIGLLDRASLLRFVEQTLASSSEWLMEAALYQAALLPSLPEPAEHNIRKWLLWQHWSGRLSRERDTIRAQLGRLPRADHFLAAFRLCRAIAFADYALIAFAMYCLIRAGFSATQRGWPTFGICLFEAFIVLAARALMIRPWNLYASMVERQARQLARSGDSAPSPIELTRWHALALLANVYVLMGLADLGRITPGALHAVVPFALAAWWSNSAHVAVERGKWLAAGLWLLHLLLTPVWYFVELLRLCFWTITHPLRIAFWVSYVGCIVLAMPVILLVGWIEFIVDLGKTVVSVRARNKWLMEKGDIEGLELLHRLSSIQMVVRPWVLEDVFRSRRLSPSEESVRCLERLGVVVVQERAKLEARRKHRRLRTDLAVVADSARQIARTAFRGARSTRNVDFDGWLAQCLQRDPYKLATWTEVEIDLIWRLVEQAHMRRAAAEGSVTS